MSDSYIYSSVEKYYTHEKTDNKAKILKILVIVLSIFLVLEAVIYTVVMPCLSSAKITFVGLNSISQEEILSQLENLQNKNHINVMIHEQYFYKDYHLYQEDFEEKLAETFSFLTKNGYESKFFEEII